MVTIADPPFLEGDHTRWLPYGSTVAPVIIARADRL